MELDGQEVIAMPPTAKKSPGCVADPVYSHVPSTFAVLLAAQQALDSQPVPTIRKSLTLTWNDVRCKSSVARRP